ncbi:MAG: hypothetical protein ACRENG_24405, partial [bacterium]
MRGFVGSVRSNAFSAPRQYEIKEGRSGAGARSLELKAKIRDILKQVLLHSHIRACARETHE